MGYTPSFTPQYENGWEDLPSETSPITAEALNAYDDAIENVEEYLASDESQANLADAYDETATYEAGDYRIHNGTLYKANQDIDTAEEFDPTKWDACIVTNEMATSGGTTVIANPSGQATDTLTKLQVENTIYGISGGGGNANIWTGTQAELEEVFDELEEGTQINITDDEQEVVEGGTIYSEEEQVIGLWTDNKPLYQKTINIGHNASIDYDISDLNIDNCINCYGVIDGYGNVPNITPYMQYSITMVVTGNNTLAVRIGSSLTVTNDIIATIQYTKSTDAPLDVVVGKKTMYIASSDCYSTEEKEVGCWTDGKPLYQRTLVIDNVTQTQNTTVDLATLSDIDHIQVIGATGFESGIVYAIPEFSDRIQFNVSTGKLQSTVPANAGWANATLTITIQYTKTTDTAGSGSYTPASGKAVHYSTDEQVIGTYVDGKPIYRKSFTYASASLSSGQFVLANNLSNVERVINKHCQVHSSTDNRDYDIPYFRSDYNESVFLLCHVLTDNTVATSLLSNDHVSYNSLTDIVVTLEYTKTTD